MKKLFWICFLVPAVFPVWAEPAGPAVWREARSGLEFVPVAGGCFPLGADVAGEISLHGQPSPPRRDELPRHDVCVDAFWLGRTEVTAAAWQRVMGGAPPALPEHPVAQVSSADIEEFLRRLNAGNNERFRLPTEAEWEHACRSGEPVTDPVPHSHARHQELQAVANFNEIDDRIPAVQPVASRQPNRHGLHDMLGNVWEWVADDYADDAYTRHARNNPRHTAASGRRVLRGGSFQTTLDQVRCGARAWSTPAERLTTIGLRVLRAMPPSTRRKK